MKKIFTGFSCLVIMLLSGSGFAQVTVTSSDSLSCLDTCTTLTAHVTGDTPSDAGVTMDDIYSALHPIGFTFNYYGVNYTQVCLGANGTLDFNVADAGLGDPWPIGAPLLGNASKYNNICGPWCDIDIFYTGIPVGTETYSTDGVAPFRKFVVTWCGCSMFSCGTQKTTSQIIIYETTNIIEVHIAQKPVCAGWNGGYAIVGVQNATGSRATTAPGRDYPSVWTIPPTEAWRFAPNDTGTGVFYTVASIPYAPVPLASSSVYWYNATTGAYLGSGLTQTVCPHTTTTYKAGALGCADTSFGYYTVTPGGAITITTTSTNPTICGICNGTITIHGLNPGSIDTIHYLLGGISMPPVVATASGTGTVTLSGLCTGTYSSIFVASLSCVSPPVGPITLTNPLIPITTSSANPTLCGLCNGTLTIYGLTPGDIDTVNYDIGGVPQPHVIATVAAGGSITLTGLCAGTYSNIIVSQSICHSITAGPVVLGNPALTITTTFSNPTRCGLCDGSISINGLHPGALDTINYDLGGVAQPPFIAVVPGGGSIQITGLCAGTYTNIIVTQYTCTSNTAGPDVLVDPPISISSFSHTDPTFCGVCNGTITLNGLYPSHSFNISYDINGVPQPVVFASSSSTGSITLTGLCGDAPPLAGTVYSNIVASFGTCITPPVGPVTLAAPATIPGSILTSTNITQCGYCDGTITMKSLTPFSVDSVFYSLAGIPQTPVVTLAHSDSTVEIISLCPGTYSAFSVSIGQCVYNITGNATLTQPRLTAGFGQTTHYGCKGDTVFFDNLSVTPGIMYYRWNFGDGTTDTATNPKHIYAQGIYTVTLIATNLHCTDSFKLPDSLIHPLVAAFIDSPVIVCQGSPITFTNNTTLLSTPPLSYIWNFRDGGASNSVNPTYTFNHSGVYNVQLVASNFVPCYDTTYSKVYIDSSSPISIAVTDSVFCRSTYVTFTGNFTTIGSVGFTWNFGDGDSTLNKNPASHSYDQFGTYTVTLNAYYRACRDTSATRTISIFPEPIINLGADTSICPGSEPITVGDNNNIKTAGTKWKWNTGQTTPSIVVTEPGYYSCTVTINGCESVDTVWVQKNCYMDIPNVFSPNNDGLNDYFFPRLYLTKGLTNFKMDIYNRWGQLIFETTTLDGSGWDGKLNGVDQPEGVYVYIIDANFIDREKEHHQGNVTLLR